MIKEGGRVGLCCCVLCGADQVSGAKASSNVLGVFPTSIKRKPNAYSHR